MAETPTDPLSLSNTPADSFTIPITIAQVVKVLNSLMNDDDKTYLIGIATHGGSFEIDIPGCSFIFIGIPDDESPEKRVYIGVKYYLVSPCQEYHFVTPVAVVRGPRTRSVQHTDDLTATSSEPCVGAGGDDGS